MIKLTDAAVKRIRDIVEKQQAAIGLRVGVVESGCSGYSYALDYAQSVNDDDVVVEQDDVKVIIDKKSLPILDETELDFVKEGLNEGFKFNNPNVKDECGCGESFNV